MDKCSNNTNDKICTASTNCKWEDNICKPDPCRTDNWNEELYNSFAEQQKLKKGNILFGSSDNENKCLLNAMTYFNPKFYCPEYNSGADPSCTKHAQETQCLAANCKWVAGGPPANGKCEPNKIRQSISNMCNWHDVTRPTDRKTCEGNYDGIPCPYINNKDICTTLGCNWSGGTDGRCSGGISKSCNELSEQIPGFGGKEDPLDIRGQCEWHQNFVQKYNKTCKECRTTWCKKIKGPNCLGNMNGCGPGCGTPDGWETHPYCKPKNSAECRQAADALNLKVGNVNGYGFIKDDKGKTYKAKGCYYYTSGKYKGYAFWGSGTTPLSTSLGQAELGGCGCGEGLCQGGISSDAKGDSRGSTNQKRSTPNGWETYFCTQGESGADFKGDCCAANTSRDKCESAPCDSESGDVCSITGTCIWKDKKSSFPEPNFPPSLCNPNDDKICVDILPDLESESGRRLSDDIYEVDIGGVGVGVYNPQTGRVRSDSMGALNVNIVKYIPGTQRPCQCEGGAIIAVNVIGGGEGYKINTPVTFVDHNQEMNTQCSSDCDAAYVATYAAIINGSHSGTEATAVVKSVDDKGAIKSIQITNGGSGYTSGNVSVIISLVSAKSHGAVSDSKNLIVDTNMGTITTDMRVTGSGIPDGGVKVTTVTDQQHLILASAITIDDNVDLVFTPLVVSAKSHGAVSDSKNLIVDTNIGTITTDMRVTGRGISSLRGGGGVKVTTVTDQQHLILASAITIDDNVDLVFTPLVQPANFVGDVIVADNCIPDPSSCIAFDGCIWSPQSLGESENACRCNNGRTGCISQGIPIPRLYENFDDYTQPLTSIADNTVSLVTLGRIGHILPFVDDPIKDPFSMIKEINRILRPGGRIEICVDPKYENKIQELASVTKGTLVTPIYAPPTKERVVSVITKPFDKFVLKGDSYFRIYVDPNNHAEKDPTQKLLADVGIHLINPNDTPLLAKEILIQVDQMKIIESSPHVPDVVSGSIYTDIPLGGHDRIYTFPDIDYQSCDPKSSGSKSCKCEFNLANLCGTQNFDSAYGGSTKNCKMCAKQHSSAFDCVSPWEKTCPKGLPELCHVNRSSEVCYLTNNARFYRLLEQAGLERPVFEYTNTISSNGPLVWVNGNPKNGISPWKACVETAAVNTGELWVVEEDAADCAAVTNLNDDKSCLAVKNKSGSAICSYISNSNTSFGNQTRCLWGQTLKWKDDTENLSPIPYCAYDHRGCSPDPEHRSEFCSDNSNSCIYSYGQSLTGALEVMCTPLDKVGQTLKTKKDCLEWGTCKRNDEKTISRIYKYENVKKTECENGGFCEGSTTCATFTTKDACDKGDDRNYDDCKWKTSGCLTSCGTDIDRNWWQNKWLSTNFIDYLTKNNIFKYNNRYWQKSKGCSPQTIDKCVEYKFPTNFECSKKPETDCQNGCTWKNNKCVDDISDMCFTSMGTNQPLEPPRDTYKVLDWCSGDQISGFCQNNWKNYGSQLKIKLVYTPPSRSTSPPPPRNMSFTIKKLFAYPNMLLNGKVDFTEEANVGESISIKPTTSNLTTVSTPLPHLLTGIYVDDDDTIWCVSNGVKAGRATSDEPEGTSIGSYLIKTTYNNPCLGGAITAVKVWDAGEPIYKVGDPVIFTDHNNVPGSGATAHVNKIREGNDTGYGTVVSIEVTYGGSGYTNEKNIVATITTIGPGRPSGAGDFHGKVKVDQLTPGACIRNTNTFKMQFDPKDTSTHYSQEALTDKYLTCSGITRVVGTRYFLVVFSTITRELPSVHAFDYLPIPRLGYFHVPSRSCAGTSGCPGLDQIVNVKHDIGYKFDDLVDVQSITFDSSTSYYQVQTRQGDIRRFKIQINWHMRDNVNDKGSFISGNGRVPDSGNYLLSLSIVDYGNLTWGAMERVPTLPSWTKHCAADYGTTTPCCGQKDKYPTTNPVIHLENQCTEDFPKCANYEYGHHMGICQPFKTDFESGISSAVFYKGTYMSVDRKSFNCTLRYKGRVEPISNLLRIEGEKVVPSVARHEEKMTKIPIYETFSKLMTNIEPCKDEHTQDQGANAPPLQLMQYSSSCFKYMAK